MNVVGIGLDVCPIDRVERAWQRHGDRLLVRLFTADERNYCWSRGNPWQSFAARFAAKEATSKSLGAPRGIGWHDVEVVAAVSGQAGPAIVLRGLAAETAANAGIEAILVSLTHAAGVAAAVALAVAAVQSST